MNNSSSLPSLESKIFNQATEELKLNLKVADNVISDKLVKSFVEYELFKPKKYNLYQLI